MRITVNGEEREFPEDIGLSEVLSALGVNGAAGIAVAVNASVVSRSAREHYRVRAGDAIEIVRAVAGG
jgi:sulfur carrier protein